MAVSLANSNKDIALVQLNASHNQNRWPSHTCPVTIKSHMILPSHFTDHQNTLAMSCDLFWTIHRPGRHAEMSPPTCPVGLPCVLFSRADAYSAGQRCIIDHSGERRDSRQKSNPTCSTPLASLLGRARDGLQSS